MTTAITVRSESDMELAEQELRHAAVRAANILKLPGTTHKIQGRRYVGKEGSTAIGQTLGLFPHQDKPVGVFDDAGEQLLGWEASCRIVDQGGTVRAVAHATCWLDEVDGRGQPRWEKQTAYSMAQTRALVKGYGMVIAPIIAISDAKVFATPAEEMPARMSPVDDLPIEQPAGDPPGGAARRRNIAGWTANWFSHNATDNELLDPEQSRLLIDKLASMDTIQTEAQVATALKPLLTQSTVASRIVENGLALL